MVSDKKILEEAITVKKRVDSVRNKDSLVFPLFTDWHTRGLDTEQTKRLLEALGIICETVKPDAVINLGDNLSMLGRQDHISNQEIEKLLSSLFDRTSDKVDCPLFLINGNHDAVGTDFYKSELWCKVAKGKYDGGLANYHTDGYFYVDYKIAKLRLIFLSIPYGSDIKADNPTPFWAVGKEQLCWLKNQALDTDYDVLLFTHVPLYYKYRENSDIMIEVWNGEKVAKSHISVLCGWVKDETEAVDILNNSKKIVAAFSGHTHMDFFFESYEKCGENQNLLSCSQVVTKNASPYNIKENELGIAIDVLVYNPCKKTIDIIRFGDGEDRKIV